MKRMTQLFILLLSSGVVLSSIADDNTVQQSTMSGNNHYNLTVRMGWAVNRISTSQLISPPAAELDPELFNTNYDDNHFLDYGLEFTYLTPLSQAWSLHTGVGYFYGGKQKINGEYYARPVPPADQNYTFDLQVQRLLAVTELWYRVNSSWSVFGGINAGMARIYSTAVEFTSIPQPGGASLPLTSSEQKTDNFAYGVSLGTSYALNAQWSVKGGVDYSWLQDVSVPYYNGVSNVSVNIGRLSPYEFWLGVAYQF